MYGSGREEPPPVDRTEAMLSLRYRWGVIRRRGVRRLGAASSLRCATATDNSVRSGSSSTGSVLGWSERWEARPLRAAVSRRARADRRPPRGATPSARTTRDVEHSGRAVVRAQPPGILGE